MARIQPTPSTIKKLFALSGNECSSPNCRNRLIEDDVILGEVCHIEAAEKGGPRYDKRSDDNYRRSFENLILLCESCHKKIDSDVVKYSTALITDWKEKHNKGQSSFEVSNILTEGIIKKFMNQSNNNNESGTQINNQALTQNIKKQIATQNNYFGSSEGEMGIEGNYRPVNKDLKKKIDVLREDASPPKKDVIDFRNNLTKKEESDIYELPFKELKFRKKNGRIKAEVESYEKQFGEINEISEEGQEVLRGFLKESDPEKKEVLKQQIRKKGQREPAIITCDGFLINGNRRKMVFEELYEKSHQSPQFLNMRVVILPENVTEYDIKRLENSYQLQDEGKSEYHGLNRALTIRDNINEGYTLEAQILDDPQYADKKGKELQAAKREFKKKFLLPLERVDQYLKTFNREGLYNTISEGTGDKEGRWQAFIDYSSFYQGTLKNPSKLRELGVQNGEEGLIENAIFKIIRKRNLNSKELERALGKVHSFVRGGNLKKYIENPTAKKHLIAIAKEVDEDIPEKEKKDKEGNRYKEREIDEKWGNKYKNEILGNLMQAYKAVNNKIERDKPVDLLNDALKKLNHDNLKIENMGTEHYNKALSLTKKIMAKAESIYNEVDHARGELKRLSRKGKSI
ncbi:hypothetical protein GUA46_07920 [Muricauda sp. HICW]|uniref:HNH endonuclease n=1 Tax=Flagellimonas chongwuensis TaxID=2697365 RepID=A0A850NE17_9FLAO|nr:hypothetical protein [Allomuricauda chongwuensis]NVN18264.1 hypothetical protein [Allomuricauda chongwuensis]